MPSVNERQAKMFWRAYHDPDYAASRNLKPEGVEKMYREDINSGQFFTDQGVPKFPVPPEDMPTKLRPIPAPGA